ncbi:oligosaccharide flippase family protein [Salibacterium qingdaonense]|uniref:Membrane protein involved in the export of O-antigen and teichoic acid n=1 Tax=Salibacterium qingdaonense TaxID=266892 RepID=A0A1I4IEM6_9BACI|nr:oligosaccharide flippase family protein [Salibacterium qingdaonense]SFL52818.1 Membrane protein involved in the export of O-antigen and teichoic acid [Salibacterium qingdaonense]
MSSVLWKNIWLLMGAALLGECLEFTINIVLARELGETGLGLYMSILPVIMFLAVIAGLELPASLSKATAEKDPMYHRSILQHTFYFASGFTIVCLAVGTLIFPLLPVFNDYHPLLSYLLLLLVPITSFSSVARGYFMGAKYMGKIAAANVLQRVTQLVLLVIVFRFFHVETEAAILLSLVTLIASELAVCMYLLPACFRSIRQMKQKPRKPIEKRSVLRLLLSVSLPATGLRIFHAASFAVKPFLIKAALVQAGVGVEMAVVQYGKLAGVAFTIGFFPAFIAHSLLLVLIPAVSEAYAKKEIHQLETMLRRMAGFTLIYAVPAVCLFFFFADELTALFFEESPASVYLQLLTPYFFFHFFVIPMQAFLIGLGLVTDAFVHSVWSTSVSFLLMYVLGSMPELRMDGIILGMNTGVVLLAGLHAATIRHRLQEPIGWKLREI